jgi:hypothetical protein
LEVLESYPRPPTFIGAACAGIVSSSTPGVGWSDKLADVEGAGQVDVEIDDVIVERHEGRTARVDGEDVTVNLRALRRAFGGDRVVKP